MGRYDDIINMPHHISKVHKKMSLEERAAQFAPFAALTGYEEKIAETSRLTSGRVILSQDAKEELDMQLSDCLLEKNRDREICVTYFVPDMSKQGGAYISVTGTIKKVDRLEKTLMLKDGTSIDLDEILSIECD